MSNENQLIVPIKMDDSQLNEALNRASQSLKDFGNVCGKVNQSFKQIGQTFAQVQDIIQIGQRVYISAMDKMHLVTGIFQTQCALAKMGLTQMGVGFTSLKVCMMGVQGTFSVLMQSLNAAIASNPIGWIIAGTAAFLALGNAIFGANQKMEEMSDTAQKEADAWKQKNNDIDERINRLQELSQYENLTNQENAEMELLLNQLQKAGVNVNEMFDEQSGTSFETMVDSIKTFQQQLGVAQLGDPGILPLNILVHPASAYRPFNFQVNVVEQNHF